ncbi:MAG: dockerin type I repeat-containing protein, partial [Muribaculaceae bacterium]|nr:dockerin type I repeat-containing protein [Muribaculaceae bacterium]
ASTAALKSEIPNLAINATGTNKLSASKEVVSLVESAQIGGNGELVVTSTGSSGLIVALAGYKDITVSESVKVRAANNSSEGIGVISLGNLSVNSPDAQLRGFGKFASLGYSELLAGTITEPQGGQPVYYSSLDNYFVGDANGNIVRNAWVTINGTATFMPGDVNGDGSVTSADITALYNYLLNGDSSYIVNGDQNGDGEITSADVTAVYNILLGN